SVAFDASFFISSRRRHTRSKRDWSSDVCSSDLYVWYNISINARGENMYQGIECKIYPNEKQCQLIHMTFGHTRFIWNEMLAMLRSEERRVGKECWGG